MNKAELIGNLVESDSDSINSSINFTATLS